MVSGDKILMRLNKKKTSKIVYENEKCPKNFSFSYINIASNFAQVCTFIYENENPQSWRS
jgi:hypothetical protein